MGAARFLSSYAGVGRLFCFLHRAVKSKFTHQYLRQKYIHCMCAYARVFKSAMYFYLMSIGENIRKLRKAKRLTQAELGSKIGTTQKVIADYENGISKPPRDRLFALAKFFSIPVERLIGKTDITVIPDTPQDRKIHGNKRTAKLIVAFEKLTETEQRVVLNQIQALAEKKNTGKNTGGK